MPKKEQSVILKGRAGGIDILLNAEAEFAELGRGLREKVVGAREFFAEADTQIAFKGRALSEEEERQLLDIILAETTLDVSFVAGEDFIAPPAPRQKPPAVPALTGHTEHNTAFYHYKHGLRSGQSIRFEGSVVVLGDVNPGSEIIAHGNVVVLGSLKGRVYAGAGGDDTCFVSAIKLIPSQLRIAGIIVSQKPEEEAARKKRKKIITAWAYIKGGQIFIAPHMD